MVRNRAACTALTTLAVFVVLLSHNSRSWGVQGARDDDKKQLEKKLEKLQKELDRERGRLDEQRPRIESEYQKLMDVQVRATLASAVNSIAERHKAKLLATGDRLETAAAVRKDLRGLIQQSVGPNLTKLIESELASNLVDRVTPDGKFSAEEVLKITIEDRFAESDFKKNFDEVIRPALFEKFAKLTREIEVVKRQLEEIEKAEASKKAGLPPKMAQVPAGSVRVGIDDSEIRQLCETLGYGKDPSKVHLVYRSTPSRNLKIDEFFLDVNEVTCAWWEAFLKEHKDIQPPVNWPEGKIRKDFENRPVTGVSYEEADRFAAWMGRRLPTEFEWEAAARQGQGNRYWPWGDEFGNGRCNHDASADHPERRSLPAGVPPMISVGSFPEGKSDLGLNDLVGNAFEWTSSEFKPYEGFKSVNVNGRHVTSADFARTGQERTIRGGDALKRDVVVSTFWRMGLGEKQSSPYVGFRTAQSAVRGKDHLARLTEGKRLREYFVDYELLPSDLSAGSKYPSLDMDDPSTYSSVMAGGWNEASNLPSKARFITIAARRNEDFRNHNVLKQLGRDTPVFVGYLSTDVDFIDPPLPAGEYCILWRNAFKAEPEEEGTDPKDPKDPKSKEAKKPAKPTKPAKGKKDELIIPDAFEFHRRGTRKTDPIRVESFIEPVVAPGAPTRVSVDSKPPTPGEQPVPDSVELLYSYPIKFNRKSRFFISLKLKTRPGEAAAFK